MSTTSPAQQPAAEDRLEGIRYMRQLDATAARTYEWRKFREDFPSYAVNADGFARPRTT